MKKRLEQIKWNFENGYDFNPSSSQDNAIEEDFKWLINQVELFEECKSDALKMHQALTEIADHDLITEHANADDEGNDLIYIAQRGLGRSE